MGQKSKDLEEHPEPGANGGVLSLAAAAEGRKLEIDTAPRAPPCLSNRAMASFSASDSGAVGSAAWETTTAGAAACKVEEPTIILLGPAL